MGEINWEADVECTHCGGTGLYIGMAERDGAAVVCYYCHGSGKIHVHHTYTEFTSRQENKRVERVYQTSGGFIITAKDIRTKEGKDIHFSKAGATYEEWKQGKKLKPIFEIHCPLQHFGQGTEIGEYMKDNVCCDHNIFGRSISNCSEKHRAECWTWFLSSKYSSELI